MKPSLRKKYKFVEKLIAKYKIIPEDQKKHREIIKTKLAELKEEIRILKQSHDMDEDRQDIITQINTLRRSGRMAFIHPIEAKKYTTEELKKHLEYCIQKTKRR
jgi:hypothetical protein